MSASHRRQSQERGKQKRHLPFKILIIILVVVAFAGLSMGAGAQLENHNGFCASCHTQPETKYVQRLQKQPVDLASAHGAKGISCIACHSGPGVRGRINTMLTLGARDVVLYLSGRYTHPAHLSQPIGDVNCLKCHANVLHNRSFDNHFHVFLPQWQRAAPTSAAKCVSCHTAHTTDGQANLAWLQKARTVSQCNACHRVAGEGEG